jgi:accessory gene regulator protein AgrB
MRRRIGGWHAASALQCQVFSFLLTTTNVLAFGPILEKAPTPFLGLITIGLSVVALFVKPIYPAQLHFTDEIKKQNNRKKNHLVLLVILLQIIALANSPRFLGYFLLGMLDALLGVFAEAQSLRKRGEKNEQT